MPKIISYTPSWLSRPSPGFQLFNTSKNTQNPAEASKENYDTLQNGSSSNGDYVGPNRILARRGAEIFVVVGKQIRWADLTLLKDGWDLQQETPSKGPKAHVNGKIEHTNEDAPEDGSYRILNPSIGERIRQLSISPNGKLLALATSHTVHLAILPDSSHLGQVPNKPIKLKTYTIGPATHVLSQSPIASVLWHPCGVSGNCLVTVTTDAVVRLWEFDSGNRWSSDTTSLAIDLKKLVLGTSEEDDFVPERVGRNRGFSSYSAGLEVASACFGGTGSNDESAWSAMTLWFAMKAGDIYALCPLLPSKWQPSSTLLPSLSTTTVTKAAFLQEGESVGTEESQQYSDQYKWIQGLDCQEPTLIKGQTDFDHEVEVYSRPAHPGPIPRLQGPFQVFPEDSEEDVELSDIHVIAAKLDAEDVMSGDDSDSEQDFDEYGLSASVVCLMTRSGRLYVCLDLEGVEGQWLPRKKPKGILPSPPDPYLVGLEALDTMKTSEGGPSEWPTFSPDVDLRYSFFTTHSKGVYFFSLEPWLPNLEKELASDNSVGTPFRIDIFKNGPGTLREAMLLFEEDDASATDISVPACLALEDSDLGYFLITSIKGQPQAATLDRPYSASTPALTTEDDNYLPDMNTLAIGPARSAYQPPSSFYASSALPNFLDTQVQARHRRIMGQEIRLSTATLDLMTGAHRVLSREAYQLGVAAADLFRRCERLQDELRDQISRASEVAYRTDKVTGRDADSYLDDTESKGQVGLDERLQRARDRHESLIARHEALRKKFSKAGGHGLSEKEKLWAAEVDKTRDTVRLESDDGVYDGESVRNLEPWQRFEEVPSFSSPPPIDNSTNKYFLHQVQDLAHDLIARAQEVEPDDRTIADDAHDIPNELRQRKVAHVMELLERESSMVQAARSRLERLHLATVA